MGGGALASLPVLAATLGLAAGAVRYGWDLDNVTAPLVSTLGDVLTLPALYLATGLLGLGLVTSSLGWVLAAARRRCARARRPLRPAPAPAHRALLDPGAAVRGAGEQPGGRRPRAAARHLRALPALLILVPAHLSSSGALGGILSGRLSSQLLLGLAPPTAVPSRARPARPRRSSPALSVPVFILNGAGAHVVARALGEESPASASSIAASLLAGLAAMVVVLVIAYYGTIAAVRLGIDPDTYGIPMVSSTVDLVGALTLVVAIATLDLT